MAIREKYTTAVLRADLAEKDAKIHWLTSEVERLREENARLATYAAESLELRNLVVDALALLWADEWTPDDRDALQERFNAL